jgi:TonB dependent receptor
MDLGVRYDYFDLVDTGVQTSPRVGLAYHFTKTNSVVHAAYNRYFSPPPIEYSLLASFIGHNAVDPDERVGDVRPYKQNYFEVGWAQELRPRMSLELNPYLHSGHNSFENHEIHQSHLCAHQFPHGPAPKAWNWYSTCVNWKDWGLAVVSSMRWRRLIFTVPSPEVLPVMSRLRPESASFLPSTRLIPAQHRFSITTAGGVLDRQLPPLRQRNHY